MQRLTGWENFETAFLTQGQQRPVMSLPMPPDFDRTDIELIRAVAPFTMTGPERVFALRRATEYVVRHEIPGDIVECGVWRGGSMMAVALTLLRLGAKRRLHLFDTYEGMPPPTAWDRSFQDESAAHLLATSDPARSHVWGVARLDEVKEAMRSTGYGEDNMVFIPGQVEQTLPAAAPNEIALLRLDTDWYESTYHELVCLYPRLSVGGVLIIDDYGHWQGARRAVDQYLEKYRVKILLNRIDYTARIGVKIEAV
jgi:O-methyltransferase